MPDKQPDADEPEQCCEDLDLPTARLSFGPRYTEKTMAGTPNWRRHGSRIYRQSARRASFSASLRLLSEPLREAVSLATISAKVKCGESFIAILSGQPRLEPPLRRLLSHAGQQRYCKILRAKRMKMAGDDKLSRQDLLTGQTA